MGFRFSLNNANTVGHLIEGDLITFAKETLKSDENFYPIIEFIQNFLNQRDFYTSENFRNQPLGINGNEDCGQMAAWYIFGVMGFYPVASGTGEYAIGAPQFPKLTLQYSVNGAPKNLQIVANNLSEANMYIQKVSLDGRILTRPFIKHSEIISGKKLVFEMGPAPNKSWK